MGKSGGKGNLLSMIEVQPFSLLNSLSKQIFSEAAFGNKFLSKRFYLFFQEIRCSLAEHNEKIRGELGTLRDMRELGDVGVSFPHHP